MAPVFLISIDKPGANAPGLFTGQLALDAAGRLVPGLSQRTGDGADAIDAAWKAPTLAVANRVAALLIDHGDPAFRLTLIELTRAGDQDENER